MPGLLSLVSYRNTVAEAQQRRDADPYAPQRKLIEAYDKIEAVASTSCAGCDKTVPPGEGSLARCSLCLTARFCNRECQRRGWGVHKRTCCELAYGRLIRTLTRIAGEGKDVGECMDHRVRQHIDTHKALPHWLTEKEFNEVLLLYQSAEDKLNGNERFDYVTVLNASLFLTLHAPRPAGTFERLHNSCMAFLQELPPVDDEVGTDAWGSVPVFDLCMLLPDVLCYLKRPQEAVDFAKWVKPNLDVACLTLNPEAKGAPFKVLADFYHLYAQCCTRAMPTHNTLKERCACPLRQTRLSLFKQAVPLVKAIGRLDEAAECLTQLASGYMDGAQFNMAFEAWKECLELPWSDQSANAAHRAVECLVADREDVKAGQWIEQLLGMDARYPGRLPVLDTVRLLLYRGVLLARRRRQEEALKVLVHADELMKRCRREEGKDKEREEEVEGLCREICLDRMDYLEALGRRVECRKVERKVGVGARFRPASLVAKAEVRLGQGRMDAAQGLLGLLLSEMTQGLYLAWRWRVKGDVVWGQSLLPRITALVRRMVPEGAERDKALAMLEERGREEEEMWRKAMEGMRTLAMEEVREQVTGKPAAQGEGGAASKAARKKRRKRQKKAAQAQHDSSQQGTEAGLEQSMADLSVVQEDEASDGEEGQMDAGATQQEAVAEEEECAICLNELGGEEGEEGLACGHVLHASCLRCWASKCASLGIDTTCPVCRRPLVEEPSN